MLHEASENTLFDMWKGEYVIPISLQTRGKGLTIRLENYGEVRILPPRAEVECGSKKH